MGKPAAKIFKADFPAARPPRIPKSPLADGKTRREEFQAPFTGGKTPPTALEAAWAGLWRRSGKIEDFFSAEAGSDRAHGRRKLFLG